MKEKILFIILLFFFFLDSTYAELVNCKYSGKVQECLENQDSPRSITEFPCIQAGTGEIIFQIALDEEFKKVDSQVEQYLLSLEKSKDYYFGPNKQEPFTNGLNDIEYYLGDGGEFEKAYKKLCDGGILKEASKCFKNGEVPNQIAWNFLKKNGQYSPCELLYHTSLINYRETANLLLKDNKFQVMKDEHKKFTQKQRGKFDELIDLIMVNIGYLERIANKWRSKTKHPYN